jgi:hypothetical protein
VRPFPSRDNIDEKYGLEPAVELGYNLLVEI